MTTNTRYEPERAKRPIVPIVLLSALCLGLLSGCSSTAAEEDHAAHHIPEHRPPDLPSTAAEIRSRWSAVRTVSPSEQPTRWTELGDILRWLPEIAGESNLNRPEWEEVQRISTELEAIHDRERPATAARPEENSRRQTLLDQLDRVASLATETIYGRRTSSE
ncbi:hypothetical protein [Planctomyces sp. SH-PL14]|uniref:hypothetical protein n=1 Tax=Planctomyces sp. SH-PL14 TaxID=1632864 RepID=UPI00078B4CC7|nr:hypothetical protein [Planctomyces sp. SH-PL14]AMV18292.1 hypothetical protein VT03_10410 [Planctomyces sp. SH-PL14]